MLLPIIIGLFAYACVLTLALALCTMAGFSDRDRERAYRDRHNGRPRP